MFTKIFELQMPDIAKELIKITPQDEDSLVDTQLFIQQNVNRFYSYELELKHRRLSNEYKIESNTRSLMSFLLFVALQLNYQNIESKSAIAIGITTGTILVLAFKKNYYQKKLNRYARNKAEKLLLKSMDAKGMQTCRNCEFYNDNPYLKCSVNPNIVETEAAVDCRDYSSNFEI